MRAARVMLVLAAGAAALMHSGTAFAVDASQRSPYLPPLEGSVADAKLLSASGRDLIVAVQRGERAARILRRSGASRLGARLWLVPGAVSASTLDRLARSGVLRYAHQNGRARPARIMASAGDPSDPAPWWLPAIGADRIFAPLAPGVPLTIADSGVDTTHSEFFGNRVALLNPQAVESPHGTMVASVAAAPANGSGVVGVYPAASLRSLDLGLTCADALQALPSAIKGEPGVLNMSWGFSPDGCPALYEVVTAAFGTGMLPVASAGNERAAGSPPSIPAVYPHVLTVGSINRLGTVSAFSNQDIGLDLAAPGEEIVVASPLAFSPSGYETVAGTSFAAPIVAAGASWVATVRKPELTQLFDLLRLSARDVGAAGWDLDTGFGVLDLPRALTEPLPPVDPSEPNDDIDQVKAGGMFREATPALTRPGRGRAALAARLDWTEDPVDLYRVYVPRKRAVRLRLSTTADVDLELWAPSARTVYHANRRKALRGGLVADSHRHGRAPETLVFRNRGRRGAYFYACVYKAREANLAASYRLTVRTARK